MILQQPNTRQEFEQWYKLQNWYVEMTMFNNLRLENFYQCPFSFQQGVYTEFFRSVGIEACAPPDEYFSTGYEATVKTKDALNEYAMYWRDHYEDYSAALTAALTAAAELRERQLTTVTK